MNKKYELPEVDAIRVAKLQRELGLSRVVAHLLVLRGVDTRESVEEFLHPSIKRDWHDPFDIPGMQAVADEVANAISNHKRIVVFGDFDADGISATAVLVSGLREFGAFAIPVIPRRLDEGYGLSETALERVFALEPDMLVTVDNGIASAHEVELLLARGISVVITDHHEPGDAVPHGVPICDPKLDEACPSRNLAGVGVALKLVQVLGARFGKPDYWLSLIDLATLGTVADQMPLVGENRSLVAAGVEMMRVNPRFAISAFLAVSKFSDTISADSLAFSLLPRINSAGRMGDPIVAFDLLMADDMADAIVCMEALELVNVARREQEAACTASAIELAEAAWHGERAVIIGAEDWHEGVKGIVASRIVSKYKVPALLFSISEGIARGSGRSIGDVNLFNALKQCADCLIKFGGHAAAVGVTLEAKRLDEFKARLCLVLDELPAEQFIGSAVVDMEISLDEVTLETIADVCQLAPFGQNNRLPMFMAKSVFMEERRKIGNPAVHYSCRVTDKSTAVRGIYFHPDNLEELAECDQAVDVVFNAEVNEFRGNRNPQLMIKDIVRHEWQEAGNDTFLEELYARSQASLDVSDYAGILDVESFHTKVVGVSFDERQSVLRRILPGSFLELVREPDNPYDANAIAVVYEDEQIGYLNARLAERLASVMDGGLCYEAVLTEVTGGDGDKNCGANILVSKETMALRESQDRETLSFRKARLAALRDDELDARLKELFIGGYEPHEAQTESLNNLARGLSTLTIMATGRGKSFIFHYHAAKTALKEDKASVFVYPLRALVADQAFYLSRTFKALGLVVRVLTGETAEDERLQVFEGLADGTLDCVLTTPEFLTIHADLFAKTDRVGFVVVDEAHHIGMAKAGNRPAYANLSRALQMLGNPLVSAVTATAADDVASSIVKVLGIQRVVCDDTMRTNLCIDDERDIRERETRLAQIVATGAKSVIYVNSREQTIRLARMLRKRVPQFAQTIAFYNAGLARADRVRVEEMFRDGMLKTIVSTSAFGEGVNIPDISHVVLFHLPFNEVEFNQMAGRAGRNGTEAHIHLMFSRADARINEKILASGAPARNDLVALYRTLKAAQERAGAGEPFVCTNAELSAGCLVGDARCDITESGVSCGISVFKELGFLTTSGYGSARRIMVVDRPPRVELSASIRYLEGCGEIEEFKEFMSWALDSCSEELLGHFNKPILPTSSWEGADTRKVD